MYDGLTPLFDRVSATDLTSTSSPRSSGSAPTGPCTNEPIPYAGVRIERDSTTSLTSAPTTYDGGIFAAGWIAAEDRGLLLQQARYNGRAPRSTSRGERDRPDSGACRNSSAQRRDRGCGREQTDALLRAGKEGQAVLRDIDTFVQGINDYLASTGSANAPWTRNDVYAVNALKNQFLGQGGGDEARRSQFLGGLRKRLGAKQGMERLQRPAPAQERRQPPSIDGKFPYGREPASATGQRRPRSRQLRRRPRAARPARGTPPRRPMQASNTLMITAPLDERAAADGRRPADRLLLPRLHLGDRHARAGPESGAAPPRRRSRATC